MRASLFGSALLATSTFLAFAASTASATTVIKDPNAHPDYKVELEPHADFVLFRYGAGYEGYRGNNLGFNDAEFGAGFRATIELGDPAFIPKLNNTVGITFGIDVTNCQFCAYAQNFRIWTPVGLQWNFFLTDKWSVFAELGLMLRTDGFYRQVYGDFMGELGGRYHFTDKVALTMRIGYPFVSVGVSFFAG